MPLPSPAASPHVTSVRPQAEEPPAEPDAVRQQQRSVAVFPHMVSAGPEDSPPESREGEEPERRCSPSSSVAGERPDRPELPDVEEGELAPEHEAALQDLQHVLQHLGGEELTMVAGKLCRTTCDTLKALLEARKYAPPRGVLVDNHVWRLLDQEVAIKEMKDTEKRVKREEVQRKAQYERDERKRTQAEQSESSLTSLLTRTISDLSFDKKEKTDGKE
jgi:hypothetical protein